MAGSLTPLAFYTYKENGMIEMKIRSLKDQSLNTSCGKYMLVEGEVRIVTFKSLVEFEAYMDCGIFLPVSDDVPENKCIPVVLPASLTLNDGKIELPLSNDPDMVLIEDEPGVKILDSVPLVTPTDIELEGEMEETLLEPVLGPEEVGGQELPLSSDPESNGGSWTSNIDRVG